MYKKLGSKIRSISAVNSAIDKQTANEAGSAKNIKSLG